VIIDSSALLAVLQREAEADQFSELMLLASRCAMSAATFVECTNVVDRNNDPRLPRRLDEALREIELQIEPFTEVQAHIARDAYRDYGKGSGHPARLNLGDCFSYALAYATGEELLFKGDDFIHTDLTPAYRAKS
jgi:ribonuclease VapC